MRLQKKHLPHLIDVTSLTGEGAEGETWGDPVVDVAAYVEHKTKLVVDRRTSSTTNGQEVTAQTFIVMLTADEVLPRTKITVWKGTPRERQVEVIDSHFFDYPRTPSHVEIFAT